ncbi:histone H1.8 [Desmodus rotundus]|uniref:histone H1.8 n=1 Tax=Desmodus rotundus TaxID=9430 RepID=UPI002380C500|nr:histone H1.8 [Desmodus rotundus]
MAPGSVASSDSSTSSASLTSVSSTSGWSGTRKPGPSDSAVREPRRHPPMLRMVLEALQAGEQRRGTSVVAIKVYILQKYPTVDATRLKYLLKRALDTGMQRGLLVRPTNSKAKGATGSFKLVPKHTKKVKPRKTATMSVPRRPAEAEEEAPKKGGQTKDVEARVGKARKVPRQPDKATKALPGATGPRGKSKVKGRKNNPADDKAHRKTKAGTQSSTPMVTKRPEDHCPYFTVTGLRLRESENGAVFPAKKKTGNVVPKEAAAQGAGQRSKAKAAAAAPKDGVSKTIPAPLARKTEVPKGPGRPGMPAKALSSNGTSKKIEAKS